MIRERAKAYANMLSVYVNDDDFQKAYEILDAMSDLGDHEEIITFKANIKDFLDRKSHQGLDSQVLQ